MPCGSLGIDSALAGNPQQASELAGTGFPPSCHPGVPLIRTMEWRRQPMPSMPVGNEVFLLSSSSLLENAWEPQHWAFELLEFILCCCSLIMHVAPPFLCRLQPSSGRICPRYVHSWLLLLKTAGVCSHLTEQVPCFKMDHFEMAMLYNTTWVT